MPVVRGTLDAAAQRAGVTPTISELWVTGARDALTSGDTDTHDRLIAEQVAAAGDFDVIVLRQISMVPAQMPRCRRTLGAASSVLTSRAMRALTRMSMPFLGA